MHTIMLDQRFFFPLAIHMNVAAGMVSVDGGDPGLSFWSMVDPVGQQLTSTAVAAAAMHGSDDERLLSSSHILRFFYFVVYSV